MFRRVFIYYVGEKYMQKEDINIALLLLPDEIVNWIGSAPIYESSGHSGAKTVYIDRDGGAYLKISDKGSLFKTSQMQAFFSKYGLSSSVIKYISLDRDYLITEPIKGEDGLSQKYLSEPFKLSEIFGISLRFLHETKVTECPVNDKMSELISLANTTPFQQSHLDDIAEYIGKASADKARVEVVNGSELLRRDVLIHGDYCLGNIMINNWDFSGFIDVADGGIGDRHYDIAWGLWTLRYNLKHSKYGYRFLDAYGRNSIDADRLRICGLLAAME